MTPRARLVTIQAVIVGVLVAVVYFTLLQPDDARVPSGVHGPGLPSGLPDPGSIAGGDQDGRDQGGDEEGGAGGGPGGSGGGGPDGGSAAAPPAATAEIPPIPGLGDDLSPADQQYTSSLDALGAVD